MLRRISGIQRNISSFAIKVIRRNIIATGLFLIKIPPKKPNHTNFRMLYQDIFQLCWRVSCLSQWQKKVDTVSSISLVCCVTQMISLHDCLVITSPHWNRLGFTTKNLSQKHTSHWLCQALTQFSVQKRSILPNSSFSETSSQALQHLQRTQIRKTKQSKETLPDWL